MYVSNHECKRMLFFLTITIEDTVLYVYYISFGQAVGLLHAKVNLTNLICILVLSVNLSVIHKYHNVVKAEKCAYIYSIC